MTSVFSSLRLDLPDAPGASIGNLSSQQQPFCLHHNGIGMEENVEIYRSVVGQNGKLIQIGDYVKLSSDHHNVRISAHLTSRLSVSIEIESQVCQQRVAQVCQ